MDLRILGLTVLLVVAACADDGRPREVFDGRPDADPGDPTDAQVAAVPSSGPCYSDPRTTLRFADWTPITQGDGVGCYATYTVKTTGTELFCPCPDPAACDAGREILTAEAASCPPVRDQENQTREGDRP